MNQVLARATLLLARLGLHPEGLSLRALAGEAGIPPSTCVRLLRDLVALGWADQDGPRGTYALGPRAASLAHALPYRGALVGVARPLVSALARRLGAQVLVAVLRGDRRLVVLRADASTTGDPLCLAEERELYASASGRLLVAHLDWRGRRRLVARIGLPGPRRWPGIGTWAELSQECAAIRSAGLVQNLPSDSEMNAVAVALPDGEGGIGALAVGMAKSRWDAAVCERGARQTARRIAQAMARV